MTASRNVSELRRLQLAVGKAAKSALRYAFTKREIEKYLLPVTDRIYRKSMLHRFNSNNVDRGVGGAWLPLKPGYRKYKISEVGDLPTLVWTGDMAQSFTSENHRHHIAYVQNGVIVHGSSHTRAFLHDRGLQTPVRVLRGVDDATVAEWRLAIAQYVEKHVKRGLIDAMNGVNGKSVSSAASQGVDTTRLQSRLGEN